MNPQRGFDDFQGLLADFRQDPGSVHKRNLFCALRYQSPAEIPKGLAALSEALQVPPDEIQSEYKTFLTETLEWKGGILTPSPLPKSTLGSLEHRSDSGNAARLVRQSAGKLRFCPELNRWLIWTGDRWQSDVTGSVYLFAKAAVAGIYTEAASISDQKERQQHAAFALRSESVKSLKAMVSLARYEHGVSIRRAALDAHPFKLNVINGVVDLETGELLDHDPDFHFTKIVPVAFDLEAPAPRWDIFLDEITGGNGELKKFLQLVAGYCLTGSTREQVFFIFHGGGKNGKSTFIHILLELLSGWGAQTVPETFLHKKGAGGFSDLARLSDKRLVCAIETDENIKLAEGLIKSLSGNDRVAARHHYQEYFEYEPHFKIILTTNHKPRIRGNDCAIWRRVRLVPFTWEIPEERRDPDLADKLKAEMAGILAWAVRGCFEWMNRKKLESPEAVTAAVLDYQKEQDTVQRFVDDCCECGADDFKESAKSLFAKYRAWASENGEYSLSANRFGRRLQNLEFEKYHSREGNFYRKIRLAPEVDCERF